MIKISNKPLKNYLLLAVAMVLLGTFFFYLKFNPSPINDRAQLVLYFENGESRKFEGAVMANMTILEAVYFASLGGDFGFRYSLQDNGSVKVEKIGGVVGVENKSWHFYLNGQPINTADINKVRIGPGDSIEAKYE